MNEQEKERIRLRAKEFVQAVQETRVFTYIDKVVESLNDYIETRRKRN